MVPPLRHPVPEDARHALSALIGRWHDFSDIRALADVDLRRGGERQRLTGVLLARAPGSVRFEALSPFGQPFLYLTIHEGRLVAYDATTNEALVGPADAETSARLLNLPVDPDDLVAILAGRAVPPKDLRVAELLPPDGDGPSLRLIGRLHEQRVWLDPRPASSASSPSGAGAWKRGSSTAVTATAGSPASISMPPSRTSPGRSGIGRRWSTVGSTPNGSGCPSRKGRKYRASVDGTRPPC